MEIGWNYLSVIITIVSNITVLVSDNVICFAMSGIQNQPLKCALKLAVRKYQKYKEIWFIMLVVKYYKIH